MNRYWLSALTQTETEAGRRSLLMPELTHAAQLTESCLVLVAETDDRNGFAPNGTLVLNGNTRLAIETGARRSEYSEFQSIVSDMGTLVRRVLAPLEAPDRERALEFLASTLAVVPRSERHELSERLFGIR